MLSRHSPPSLTIYLHPLWTSQVSSLSTPTTFLVRRWLPYSRACAMKLHVSIMTPALRYLLCHSLTYCESLSALCRKPSCVSTPASAMTLCLHLSAQHQKSDRARQTPILIHRDALRLFMALIPHQSSLSPP